MPRAVEEEPEDLLERAGAADGQARAPVGRGGRADELGVLGDEAVELRGAVGLAVVEGDAEVVFRGDGGPGGGVLGDVEVGGGGEGGGGEGLYGKRGDGEVVGAGEAAAEGDEAGGLEVPRGLLEHAGLAGGGFGRDVVGPVFGKGFPGGL